MALCPSYISLLFQVLRSFYVQPVDVHYFVHDSGPYMAPMAERLRSTFGYRNLVDVPCWAHLLNLIGESLFNQKMLPGHAIAQLWMDERFSSLGMSNCMFANFKSTCVYPAYFSLGRLFGGGSGESTRQSCMLSRLKRF